MSNTKENEPKKVYGKKETYTCANPKCGNEFEARVADRARGFAKYCSRSCAATANPPHYRGKGGGPTRHKRYKGNKETSGEKA